MHLRSLFVALSLLLSLPALAGSPPAFISTLETGHPLAGKVWDPQTKAFVAIDELVRTSAAADVVILGETHDNPDHHTLQAWILRHLIAAGRKPAVAFEMLDSSQREALARHLRERPGDDAGLGAAVEWEKTGWPDWALYRPIADAALSAGLPILTANLSKDETRQLTKNTFPAAAAHHLGLDKPLPPVVQQAMEREIKSSHCDMLPDKSLPAMVQIQRARDSVMAHAIVDGIAARKSAVLIAGAGHARFDRGVPAHLATIAAGHKVFSIAFIEVQSDKNLPAMYADLYETEQLPFDMVWFTPRSQREDQCEAFRRHMEKKKLGQ
ncbi:ChaN family lipoprotein [Magnetospirillum moscoviense]|uniref:Haem-binding uptake Tiki superfamily ChaN domain-containing protein n=1 Tax=Magnetospirillum moscoviense TaxID=1437059 RepID=A0A178MJA5_9PROT|nr:ChaN family lipoprotein [Magnetospirillum moscoviense]OAN48756.1 hypothetical protein A6A05_14675 [Magnetospirillum moscoviense]